MSNVVLPIRNALIAQCGGPTAVINRCLAAVIADWQQATQGAGAHHLLGARNGMLGLATHDWVALDGLAPDEVTRLAAQPGMALGGGRHRPSEAESHATIDLLRRREVDALLLLGGNGTAAAAHHLARQNPALRVLALPKTVDNDLFGTEVAPGYGSAARYTALSVRSLHLDLHAMATFDQVVVYEAMGRHAGWLAAAAALARTAGGDCGPHLILLPEIAHDEDDVLETIARIHAREGRCLVVASEGVRDRAGSFWAEKEGSAGADASGQAVLSLAVGVSARLVRLVQNKLGLRCRQVRPNTLQRSAAALSSPLDSYLAEMVGAAALPALREGQTDRLLGLVGGGGEWRVQPKPLAEVVGRERPFPTEWLVGAHDVTAGFVEWAAPLVAPLPADPVIL